MDGLHPSYPTESALQGLSNKKTVMNAINVKCIIEMNIENAMQSRRVLFCFECINGCM